MVMKYTNNNYSKALQNLPKFGILGLKTNHLATLQPIGLPTYILGDFFSFLSSTHLVTLEVSAEEVGSILCPIILEAWWGASGELVS
jgi:hypothetical protein